MESDLGALATNYLEYPDVWPDMGDTMCSRRHFSVLNPTFPKGYTVALDVAALSGPAVAASHF